MKKLLAMICVIAYLIPVYGQNDTITADGLHLKYDSPLYRPSFIPTNENLEKLKKKELNTGPINDSDMVRGELDRVTKATGLTYKNLPQYIISEKFAPKKLPGDSSELLKTAGSVITSKWIHEDGECILFIKCHGMTARIDKSIDELPKTTLNRIKHTLFIAPLFDKMTEEEEQKVKKAITIWSPEKAKKTFNAQHVITYPIQGEKSVYMEKYIHKLELIMIKWGENLTVSFLVTEKGNKNIDKYIKDVEGAFWFED